MHAPRSQKWLRTLITIVFLFTFLPAQPGLAANTPNAPLPPEDQPIRTSYDSDGSLTFVGVDPGESLLPERIGAAASVSSEARGQQVIALYAGQFGLSDPGKELRLDRVDRSESGDTVRYQQQYQGVPVMGGELLVNTDADGSVLSLNGEVSPQLSLPSTQPRLAASQAKQAAVAGMQSWYSLDASQVAASEPELWIYDPHLLDSIQPHSPTLVWRLEAQPVELQPVNELVLVDAQTGAVALHFNQVGAAWTAQGEQPTPEPTAEPPLEPTQEPTQEPTPAPTEEPAGGGDVEAQSAQTWYVAPTGDDTGDCLSPATPCATFQASVDKAADGDTVKLAIGTYTKTTYYYVQISKGISVLGGWNAAFTAQEGFSTFDGENDCAGIWIQGTKAHQINVLFDRMIITGISSYAAIKGMGNAAITI